MISENDPPDPAALFACAVSLRDACEQRAQQINHNLSEAFQGIDQFWREVMRIGGVFEEWACVHVVFEEMSDVWPYLLEEKFGTACLQRLELEDLSSFDTEDCLSVAMSLLLPLHYREGACLPLDVAAPNPVPGSPFAQWRIQTIRCLTGDDDFEPLVYGDDPFDAEYDPPLVALYGMCVEGVVEHIKDFTTYADAVAFARKLAPGVDFPDEPLVASACIHLARS
jgi:hypothetical protein